MVNNSNQMALKNLRNIKGQTGYRKNESSIESYNSDDQVNEDLKNISTKDRRRMTTKQENIKHNNLTSRREDKDSTDHNPESAYQQTVK